MRRSGSTLQYQITGRLVEDAGIGKKVGWVRAQDFPRLRAEHEDYDGLKVFKAHVCTEEMEAEFLARGAIGVYVYRDVRDAFVSEMHRRGAGFEPVFRSRFLDRCLVNYCRWTSLPRVLVSRYEEMTSHLPLEVGRIARHLGISLGRSQWDRIAADYAIDRQRDRIKGFIDSGDFVEAVEGGPYHNPDTLLHPNHIRSGEGGQWREQLSPGEVIAIEREARSWLVERGYEPATAQWRHLLRRVVARVAP